MGIEQGYAAHHDVEQLFVHLDLKMWYFQKGSRPPSWLKVWTSCTRHWPRRPLGLRMRKRTWCLKTHVSVNRAEKFISTSVSYKTIQPRLLEHWTNDTQFQVIWGETAEKSFLLSSRFWWKTLFLSFQSSCNVHVLGYYLCISKLDCSRTQGSMTDSCCIMFRILQFFKVQCATQLCQIELIIVIVALFTRNLPKLR